MFPVEIIFNILTALFLLIYWVIVFILIYHLARFGVGIQPKRFAASLLLGSVILTSATIILATRVDLVSLLNQLPR